MWDAIFELPVLERFPLFDVLLLCEALFELPVLLRFPLFDVLPLCEALFELPVLLRFPLFGVLGWEVPVLGCDAGAAGFGAGALAFGAGAEEGFFCAQTGAAKAIKPKSKQILLREYQNRSLEFIFLS